MEKHELSKIDFEIIHADFERPALALATRRGTSMKKVT